jgi:uncharacterized membrane protein
MKKIMKKKNQQKIVNYVVRSPIMRKGGEHKLKKQKRIRKISKRDVQDDN